MVFFVRFELSGAQFPAPADFGRLAPGQSIRAARADDPGFDHREHFAVSRPDEPDRPRARASCRDALDRCVRERQIGIRRNLSGAGRHENRARARALPRRFTSVTNERRKEYEQNNQSH
jgi:hypothetical protein